MIGRFYTVQYASRADLAADRPCGLHVARNHFTGGGLEWMWKMMTGVLRTPEGTVTDHLGSARIVVGNGTQDFSPSDSRLAGDQTDQAALDQGYPTIQRDPETGGMMAVFQATFGESQATFDWQERGVVSAQGVLIDRAVADGGRKVLGAVWTCRAELVLAG